MLEPNSRANAAELLKEAAPYLLDMFRTAPAYGSVGITLIFHDHVISRIDCLSTVQRKPNSVRV